ncbi:MAG: DUF502 domain-containing protein, partial [candidate division NC10 bacterium]|nr:DUF502 domain-containing protein [candidate division NC10 bacterium]
MTFHPSVADWPAWTKRSLLTGLAVLLPAFLTVYILWLLFRSTGAFFAVPVEFLAGNMFGRSLGGVTATLIGAVLTVGLLVVVGLVAQRLGRNVFHRLEERIFQRLPVAREIHRAVRQLFDLFFTGGGAHKAVGLVEYPRPVMYALCFITSREPWWLDDGNRGQLLSVYLPTTPNPTSGYLLLVPKEDVILLDLTVDEAARIIISGGSVPIPGRHLRGSTRSDTVACSPHS